MTVMVDNVVQDQPPHHKAAFSFNNFIMMNIIMKGRPISIKMYINNALLTMSIFGMKIESSEEVQ